MKFWPARRRVESRDIALLLSLILVIGSVVLGCGTSVRHTADGNAPANSAGADVAGAAPSRANVNATIEEKSAHLDLVYRADFCAKCHAEATAEHRMNTHGRAFSDAEVRLATARFSIGGCIDCHTPRPIFETGIGRNPIKRLHHLEEANDCMSCHARAGFDFSTFEGGQAECKNAFDERAGQVEACASCHRNHGTPYQWENAQFGKKAGNVCIDCHMPEVVRPVATGMPAKKTRRHTFFASRSAEQLKMAYDYKVQVEGNEVVVKITNAGAGHNFPTELKQRSVESLVIIRDVAGREVARSRDVHRDPYKRPYGLTLPVNTQIPSGETREHRVPLPIAAGTVETQLYYKLYYPIEDGHPDLSRTLENRSFAFGPVEPSKKPIESAPEIHAVLPEAMPVQAASPGNLADFARPSIGKVEITVPDGSQAGDIEKLIAMFQFPVPEGNRRAADVLVKLGQAAVPALIEALGSWDSKTWMQSAQALIRIGAPAAPAMAAALSHKELYVRLHAAEVLGRFDKAALMAAGAPAGLSKMLTSTIGLERAYGADGIVKIGYRDAIPALRKQLNDLDFDATAAAARALGNLNDKDSLPALRATLKRMGATVETGRDIAWAIAALGDDAGANYLLDHLDYNDDLVRESIFEAFLDVTGMHSGYTPNLTFELRMEALAALRNEFATQKGARVRRPRSLTIHGPEKAEIVKLVRDAGGNDVASSDPEVTEKAVARLIEIGKLATPLVVDGMKWPAGFLDKRVALLRVLVEYGDPESVPALIDATKDPALTTSLWAARGLDVVGDAHGARHLEILNRRFDEAAAANRLPGALGHPEDMRVMLGRARARLGDEDGARLLLRLLFSGEPTARAGAEAALTELYGSEKANERAIAREVRGTLAKLPELRAAQVAAMRETWQTLHEAADAFAENAKTRELRIAALNKYDFAEEAATRYHVFDPRAFAVDFRRTTMAADSISQQLFEDSAWRNSIAARDLTSIVERKGWAQSSSGIFSKFDGDTLTLEAPENGGGSMTFGLGGPGGQAVPMEWWRDYEIVVDVTIVKKGFWILDRYDPIWAIYHQTAFTTNAPETAGVLYAAAKEGATYRVVHSVVGSDVMHSWADVKDGKAGEASQVIAATPLKVRKGGVVLQLEPGATVILKNLGLRVFRSDAAETVNAMTATPGR